MRMLLIGRGKMGTLIQQTAQAAGDEVVAALGREDLGQLASMGAADVVIDFSRPETLDAVCAYVRRTGRRCSPAPRAIRPRRWRSWNLWGPWHRCSGAPISHWALRCSSGLCRR